MSGFVSCDWGTTNLRLRWVDAHSGTVVGNAVASPHGARHAHAEWQRLGGDRTEAYYRILAPELQTLRDEIGASLDGAPIVISGMASSSIGIEELPYATLPFPIRGGGLAYRVLTPRLGTHPVALVSGVRSGKDDVMRGEETQLVGLHQGLGSPSIDAVFILPGTHSKHVVVAGSHITAFRTFMTGEIFAAVASHTILRDSVVASETTDDRLKAFLKGVRAAADSPLLHALFHTRTNQLFGRLDRADNYWYLSGVLIGDELAALVEHPDHELVLCASSELGALYEAALETLGFSDRLTVAPPEIVEQSVALGQMEVFRRL